MEPAATLSRSVSDPGDGWEQIREYARQRCDQRSVKLTSFREAVLRQIALSKQPRGAYDIATRLGAELGKRVAPNSVYRVLDLLIECGLVQRVESKQAYCLAPAQHRAGALLLMCEDCGAVEPVDGSIIEAVMSEQAKAAHFRPLRKVIEITGICEACDAAQARDG